MSVYYYLTCGECRRYVPALATHGGVASGLAGDEWLRPFLAAHAGHALECVDESDDDLASMHDASDCPTDEEMARSNQQRHAALKEKTWQE
jgi:hypothetical protein